METINRIRNLAKKQKRSLAYLCEKMGVARVYFIDREKNGREIPDEKLRILAKELNTSVAYLKGETDVPTYLTILDIATPEKIYEGDAPFNEMPEVFETYNVNTNGILLSAPKVFTIPVYESVSAGFGAYANDSIIDYRFINLSSEEEARNTWFVKVTGDSMSPKIENGDLIQVYKTDSVDSGTIAVVMMDSVDGEEAFVKRVIYGHGWVELHSINPKYAPIRFEKNDIDRIRILGEVTSIVRGI